MKAKVQKRNTLSSEQIKKIEKLWFKNLSAIKIAKEIGCSRSSVYYWINK